MANIVKKHLDFVALRSTLSEHLINIKDNRQSASCTYSIHDAVMSAFACMYFQDESLSKFQRRMEENEQRNNLRTLFDVENIPKDSQLRDILDNINSESFRPVFKGFFHNLRRGKHLENYQILPNLYICAIDGVHYHSSENVHCSQCLTKKHKNGTITYQHAVLQGAILHPDKKQVIPLMPEPIANSDGISKQDCEVNAAKRFIKGLKTDHPRLGLIITGDGLFSKTPMIEVVLAEIMNFLFVAKRDDHKYKYEQIKNCEGISVIESTDNKGRIHRYSYKNEIPLNAQKNAPDINYINYQIINKENKVVYKNSWVTNIKLDDSNVIKLAKGGRCRWKIENECFNTLKNQGYYLKHNFGHGHKYLCHNMYLLTLLAFFFHQIFELTDLAYQLCRRSYVSKKHLWETCRVLISYFIIDSWNELLIKLMSGRGGIPFLEKN